MAALNLAGKTSGYIKLKSPDVALNATVELPNKDGILATLDDVGSGGGGDTATLESLGIPNHDKVTVNTSGWLAVNGALQANSDTESHLLLNTGAGETKAQVTYKHSDSTLNFHNGGQQRMRIDADGAVNFNNVVRGLHIQTETGSDTLKLEQSNAPHGWLFKAQIDNGNLELVRFGSSDGLKYSFGFDRFDVNVPLYVQGNPKSIDVQLSDMETRLADRDKIIDKLLAKVEALEEKLKKVK